jgi:hypothetical protein
MSATDRPATAVVPPGDEGEVQDADDAPIGEIDQIERPPVIRLPGFHDQV